MRNAVIGVVMLCIITLVGVTIYSIESKTTRQNELNVNLSSAMERSLEILTIDPKYTIDKEKDEHLVADFIQDFLIRMNSRSKYKVEVLGVDAKKGLLSCRVSETYNTIFGTSQVNAERTIILDNYVNENDETFKVMFYQYKDEDTGELINPLKQSNVYEGDTLKYIIPELAHRPGYKFLGWKFTNYGDPDKVYTNLEDIHVRQNLIIFGHWKNLREDEKEGAH